MRLLPPVRVVSRDVPDYGMMMGVPARRVGWMCECGTRLPAEDEPIVCPKCSRRYVIRGDRLELESNPERQ